MCFPWYVVSIDISVDEDGESYQFKSLHCSWEFSSQFTAVLVHVLQFYIALQFSHPNLNTQTVTKAKAPFT